MKKKKWHALYKEQIVNFFKNCQKCGRKHYLQVHHNTYYHRKGVYQIDGTTAIKEGVVTVLCEECHLELHKKISIDGLTKILPSDAKKLICVNCDLAFMSYEELDYSYCDHKYISYFPYLEDKEIDDYIKKIEEVEKQEQEKYGPPLFEY